MNLLHLSIYFVKENYHNWNDLRTVSYLKLSAFPFTVCISQVQSPKTTQLLTKLGRYSLKSSTFLNEGYKRSGQSESPIAVWCPWLLFPWIWSVINPPWFINNIHDYSIVPHPSSYMCIYDICIYIFYIIYHYINILLRYLSSKHISIWFISKHPSIFILADWSWSTSSSPMSDPLSSKVNPQNASNKKATMMPWIVGGFSPTHPKNMIVKMGSSSPKFGLNIKYI